MKLLQVQLTELQKAKLRRLAKTDDATMSEVIRHLIDEAPMPTRATMGTVKGKVRA